MQEIYERQLSDAVGDTAEDIGEAVAGSAKNLPIIGDTLGDSLRNAGAVVEDVDPWG